MAKGKVVCHKVLTVMMIPSCKSCEKNSYKKKNEEEKKCQKQLALGYNSLIG